MIKQRLGIPILAVTSWHIFVFDIYWATATTCQFRQELDGVFTA